MDCMYSNQECSSGCESGWTVYLQHSSISPYNQENEFLDDGGKKNEKIVRRINLDDDDEDEDLSMVSDASSGPPHHHHHLHEEQEVEEGYGGGSNSVDPFCKKSKKKNRDVKRRRNAQDQYHSSFLDDTASSPFFDFSDKSSTLTNRSQPMVENDQLEYSQGYSSTQFEVKPPYQAQYDNLFHSTDPENQVQQNQWFEGKRW